MAVITIHNLRLRTIIGINDWERKTAQSIVVNIRIAYDTAAAVRSDAIGDAFDYKALTKKLLNEIGDSSYELLEALVAHVLDIINADARVQGVWVRIEKPGALRHADSVSLEDATGTLA